MLLRILIIFSISIFGFWLIRHRKKAIVRAWQKIMILGFVTGVIFLTIFPNLALEIALFLGLTRATDIIVYASVILLLFISASLYFKIQDLQSQIVNLVRLHTLEQAQNNLPDWDKQK